MSILGIIAFVISFTLLAAVVLFGLSAWGLHIYDRNRE